MDLLVLVGEVNEHVMFSPIAKIETSSPEDGLGACALVKQHEEVPIKHRDVEVRCLQNREKF